MRHCLIKDRLEDDLKKKLNKSHKKEIHGLRQKIKKLELENLDMKRQLDKATHENANLQVELQHAEANAKTNSDKVPIIESSHDFVTPLKSKDTNIKNEDQRLDQPIAEHEDLHAGVAKSLASNNVHIEQRGTFHFTIVNTPARGDIPKTEEG
jgi:predicted RNase H-like nuclease (RuvC/YqgF family)